MTRTAAPALALGLALALLRFDPVAAEYLPMPGAVLQGLDKITARVSELTVRNGETVSFGGLAIRVDACNERPPEEPPEATAFIEIFDGKTQPPAELFRGWMFASSPAVSPFEHPIYDVRVLRCWAPDQERR